MERIAKSVAFIVCVAALSSGCATRALWGINSCDPAPDDRLTVQFSPDRYDFLVTYREQRGEYKKTIQTNSYWLLAHTDQPPVDHRPAFVQETNRPEWITVPVVQGNEPLPETGYSARSYAHADVAPARFDLYHEGVCVGRFTLPSYSTPAGPATVSRVVLTPPAVVADTATIAFVLVLFSAYVYAQGH